VVGTILPMVIWGGLATIGWQALHGGEVVDEVTVSGRGWSGLFCSHEGVVKLASSFN
jgi:hypothetical protein